MILWAIDPGGAKPHGIAIFENGTLVGYGWALPRTCMFTHLVGRAQLPTEVVIERPVINPDPGPYSKRRKTNPRTLIKLVWAAALFAGHLTAGGSGINGVHLTEYEPSQWKAQMKKPPHHLHGWAAMTEAERALLPPDTLPKIQEACAALAMGREPNYGWKIGDILDAINLGLYHLGRVRRGGGRR